MVSKVAAEHKAYEEAMNGINKTLETMGLDYPDMMIIHSPKPWVKVNQSEDRYVEGSRAAWKALEDAYKACLLYTSKKEASLKMILRQRAFCGILEKSYSDRIKSMNYTGYWELCYQRNFHKMKS